jgi:high-affinity Fe2+/Pb2+ permease
MKSNFLAYAVGLVALIVIYLILRLTGKKSNQISFVLVEKIFIAIIALVVLGLIYFS